MKEVFFLTFSRLLTKDQIKKGTFSLVLGTGSYAASFAKQLTLSDSSASVSGEGTMNADGGDYAVLNGSDGHPTPYGVVFYQAGVAVITASVFNNQQGEFNKEAALPTRNVDQSLTGSTISSSCDALRRRVKNLSFNNTTQINSRIFFCRVPHNKFNYSANPSYLSASKIVVKNQSTDNPVSYITTVGLYNESNQLVAVAKLSEPLKKDPTNDITLRVRLDY